MIQAQMPIFPRRRNHAGVLVVKEASFPENPLAMTLKTTTINVPQEKACEKDTITLY